MALLKKESINIHYIQDDENADRDRSMNQGHGVYEDLKNYTDNVVPKYNKMWPNREKTLTPVAEVEIWMNSVPLDVTFTPPFIIAHGLVKTALDRLVTIRNGTNHTVNVNLENITDSPIAITCHPANFSVKPHQKFTFKIMIYFEKCGEVQTLLNGTMTLPFTTVPCAISTLLRSYGPFLEVLTPTLNFGIVPLASETMKTLAMKNGGNRPFKWIARIAAEGMKDENDRELSGHQTTIYTKRLVRIWPEWGVLDPGQELGLQVYFAAELNGEVASYVEVMVEGNPESIVSVPVYAEIELPTLAMERGRILFDANSFISQPVQNGTCTIVNPSGFNIAFVWQCPVGRQCKLCKVHIHPRNGIVPAKGKMECSIYFCIPLIVTGNPTPGTYGERKQDTQKNDAQNPETSETEAYSKYAFGDNVGYRGSVLDQFVVDQQGEYRRVPIIEDTGAVGKPALYNPNHLATPTRTADISDISNIYNTLRDRATGRDVPTRANQANQAASPSYEYGVPQLAANPALLKLSNYANPLLSAQLAQQQYEHRLKTIAALQTPVASPQYYSQVPLGVPQQQLVQLHAPQTALVQQPLYQNVLVPIHQSPYAQGHAHAQALYQQQAALQAAQGHAEALYQQEAALHAAHGVEQISLAQQVVPKLQVPLLKTAYAPTILQAPIYKTINVPEVAPLLRTAPGVQAEIVAAVEEQVPHGPITLTKTRLAQPLYSRFLPSDAVFAAPKTPNIFVQKAIFKAASAAAISPVLTEKAVLKAALAPVYNAPAFGLQKGVIKAPLLTHFVQNGYLEPGLPTKILSSQKALVNTLISDAGKAHYGHHGHGNGLAGLAAGTGIELVPSLSYGFSYSLYPKSNGIYGAPQPLVKEALAYNGHQGHGHHHSIKK
ncbi:unnamed protein product [Orchesella dallaii]|uniref:Uncharacterized protein n=1 Tax=Orchesella dallaii TaxID=48710 RepID=A0ABP1RXC0_9HEXA